jgi:spore coat polysaccharide biosynthesis protein SpsF
LGADRRARPQSGEAAERRSVLVDIGVVVQARMSSARLPGKVLMPLAGKALLAWLVERLRQTALPVVIATSRQPEDDGVEQLAASLGTACHRGPLDDVAARLAGAAEAAGFDAFVRANADSPLLDPALVRKARALYSEQPVDLVTNVFPRSFPKGMSVELIALGALRRMLKESQAAEDREHVTRYVYAHPEAFRIRNFAAERPQPALQLSVDTPEDFARMEACIRRLGAGALTAGWEEIADCAGAAA